MNLHEALRQIAADSGLNADELIAYAAEDNIGGRDTGQFAAMSVHADEGRVLYALVRALKPKQCLEIGVAEGCTATHILTALERNGGTGNLTSIDVEPEAGRSIPEELKHRWEFIVGDGLEVKLPKKVDFAFEDGPHTYPFTKDMLERLIGLKPRIILAHDMLTHHVYHDFKVYVSWEEVLGPDGFRTIGIDGAFTGLGYVWRG